jgi:hypothetical protein
LLTEGLVLSAIGGLAGLALGFLGLRALITLTAQEIPGMVEASLQPAVVLFTLGLAVLTGVVFGLVPSLVVVRRSTGAVLKDESARASASRAGTPRGIAIAETALALALRGRSAREGFARLQQVDPVSTGNVLTARVALPATLYPNATARAIPRAASDRLRVLPVSLRRTDQRAVQWQRLIGVVFDSRL